MSSQQKEGTRRRLWKRQRGKCYYCKRDTVIRKIHNGQQQPHNLATLDHVVPLSKDGVFAPTRNCVMACRLCNEARGSKSQAEFLQIVEAGR